MIFPHADYGKMKNKKAQFKIQQMAFMLIGLVAFFALVGIFVLAFNLSQLKNSANLLEQKNAELLITKLADSPEFSCGNAFLEEGIRTGCIDADKVMMLKQSINKYKDFWGVSSIQIRTIYPAQTSEKECTSSNYPDCNIIKLLQNSSEGYDYSNFVSLCKKQTSGSSIYDECNVAELTIRYGEIIG